MMETSRSVKEVALRKEQTTHRVTVWGKLQAALSIDVCNISGGMVCLPVGVFSWYTCGIIMSYISVWRCGLAALNYSL